MTGGFGMARKLALSVYSHASSAGIHRFTVQRTRMLPYVTQV